MNPAERPENEGLELFDANETLEEEEDQADAESKSNENCDDDQDGEDQANASVASISFQSQYGFLGRNAKKLRESKKRCKIHMMSFFARMENSVAEACHKCLKHDGNCFDSFE